MKINKLTSYAKINLDLKIKYYDKIIKKHKISSKVVLLKLNDLIKVSNSTKLQITYYDQNKKIIKLKNDIIKKSILFFDRKYKTKTKLKFLVYKKIPVGYGLGGGSSNAASILKFLYKYHQITSKNFEKDAPLIGSDVIIFKDKYPKIIDGLSQYKYLNAKKYCWRKVYLIFPSQKNLTKKIYNYFKNHNMGAKKQLISQNNLTSSSMLLNKEFKELFMFLLDYRKDFLKFGMSGSGSSIFVSFKKIAKERSIFREINKFYPSVRIEKSSYFG